MKYILLLFSLFLVVIGHAQVGIGDVVTPHKNSSLHIGMDNKGLILPKAVDSTLVNSITLDPTMAGMVIFDSRDAKLKFYDGIQWGEVYSSNGSSSASFERVGIGTKSLNKNSSLDIRTNNKGIILPKAIDSTLVNNTVVDPTMAGMIIYDNRDKGLKLYNGGEWGELHSSVSEAVSFKQMAIGKKTLNPKASLDIQSNNRGIILPKAIDSTLVNNTVVDPTMAGMLIFDNRDKGLKLYNGGEWGELPSSVSEAVSFKRMVIGKKEPNPNASLDIKAENKGIILPRATNLSSIVGDPSMDGMLLYDPSTKMVVVYDGISNSWQSIKTTNSTAQDIYRMLAFRVDDTPEQAVTCLALVCTSVGTVDFGNDSSLGAYDPFNMYDDGIVTIPADGYYEVDLSSGLGSVLNLSLGSSVTNTNLQFRTDSSGKSWTNIGSDQQGFTALLGLGTWAIGKIKNVYYFNKGNQLKVSIVPNFTISLGKSVIMNDSSRTYIRVTKTN